MIFGCCRCVLASTVIAIASHQFILDAGETDIHSQQFSHSGFINE
jgi:hypothetical protein